MVDALVLQMGQDAFLKIIPCKSFLFRVKKMVVIEQKNTPFAQCRNDFAAE